VRRRSLVFGSAAAAALASARAQSRTTLRFLWWGGSDRHQRTLKALAAFEARHPGLRVKAEYMGFNGYLEKLTTQMVGSTEPDVMQINWAWLQMFSRHGTGFLDLQPHAAALAPDEYDPDELAMCRIGGHLNGLPLSFSARIFLWNVAALARAGLGVPQTWDELFAAGAPLRSALGERAHLLDGEPYDMLLLAQTLTQQRHGSAYLHPTQPKVAMSDAALLDWVQNFQRLYAPGLATPVPYRASLGGLEKPLEQQPDWVVGRWAGTYTWDSVIRLRQSTLDKAQTLDVGPFLTATGAKDSGMFGRPSLLFALSKHCRHAQAAVALLRFLTTDSEAAALLGSTRGTPSARSARSALQARGALPPLEVKAQAQITEQRRASRLTLPAMRFEDARMRRFLREVFERLAYGRLTPEAAAARLRDGGAALTRRIK
jgi:oligogalacturonide transport system substrate-binding protein